MRSSRVRRHRHWQQPRPSFRLISASVRPLEALDTYALLLAGRLVLADTLRMPLASISNVTSIWGMPRGAGAIPVEVELAKQLVVLLPWAFAPQER